MRKFTRGWKPKNQFQTKRNDKPKEMSGLTVIVRNNDVNKAIRVLKKKMLNEGIMKEMRDRSDGYKKPSERKRIAKKAGAKRWQKKVKEIEARGEW